MAESGIPRIGFLGAGRMATALARGWLSAGLVRPDGCRASDPLPQARQAFTAETGLPAGPDNRAVVTASDVLVLAVKPQSMAALLSEVRGEVRRQLVVSIAAGVTLRQLTEALGTDCRLVRVMPNTPCLLGASASAYAEGPAATPDDVATVVAPFPGAPLFAPHRSISRRPKPGSGWASNQSSNLRQKYEYE